MLLHRRRSLRCRPSAPAFDRRNERGNALHLAREALLRQRVEADAHRLAVTDLRRIRPRPSAPSRRGRSRRSGRSPAASARRGRGRRVFADLADDLGHGAVERRIEDGAPCSTFVASRRAAAERRPRPGRLASWRVWPGASARASSREPETKPLSFSEACRSASRSALAAMQASATRFCRLHLRGGELRLRLLVVVPQLHQAAGPFVTRSPSLTASTSMRPPRMVDSLVRWQASTVPARVGDRRFDLAAVDLGSTTTTGFG